MMMAKSSLLLMIIMVKVMMTIMVKEMMEMMKMRMMVTDKFADREVSLLHWSTHYRPTLSQSVASTCARLGNAHEHL